MVVSGTEKRFFWSLEEWLERNVCDKHIFPEKLLWFSVLPDVALYLPASPFFIRLVTLCFSLSKIVICSWFWWNLVSASEILLLLIILYSVPHTILQNYSHKSVILIIQSFLVLEKWVINAPFFYQVTRDLSFPRSSNGRHISSAKLIR